MCVYACVCVCVLRTIKYLFAVMTHEIQSKFLADLLLLVYGMFSGEFLRRAACTKKRFFFRFFLYRDKQKFIAAVLK